MWEQTEIGFGLFQRERDARETREIAVTRGSEIWREIPIDKLASRVSLEPSQQGREREPGQSPRARALAVRLCARRGVKAGLW